MLLFYLLFYFFKIRRWMSIHMVQIHAEHKANLKWSVSCKVFFALWNFLQCNTTLKDCGDVDRRREAGSTTMSHRAAAHPLSAIRVKCKQCWNIYNHVEEMRCSWRGEEERERNGLHAPPVSWHSRAALLCRWGCFCETRSCITFPSSSCHTHSSLLMLCKWI